MATTVPNGNDLLPKGKFGRRLCFDQVFNALDLAMIVQGPRSRGGGGGHVSPPNIFRVSMKKFLMPLPLPTSNIEALMCPSNHKVVRGPCSYAPDAMVQLARMIRYCM